MSRLSGWSDVMGWAQNLLIVEHDYLPKYWMVFRKTNSEPYILRQEITDIEELLSLEPSGRSSVVSGDFIWRNFPSFSVERVTCKYFKKLFVDLIEFYTSKEISYLFIFLEF